MESIVHCNKSHVKINLYNYLHSMHTANDRVLTSFYAYHDILHRYSSTLVEYYCIQTECTNFTQIQ